MSLGAAGCVVHKCAVTRDKEREQQTCKSSGVRLLGLLIISLAVQDVAKLQVRQDDRICALQVQFFSSVLSNSALVVRLDLGTRWTVTRCRILRHKLQRK